MKMLSFGILCGLAWFFPIIQVSGGEGSDTWQKPLLLQEEQGGIAGKQIWTWEVLPDGNWRSTQFHQDSQGMEVVGTRKEKKGTLTEKEIKNLAEVLKSHKVTQLPAQIGKEAKINAHRYILSIGSFQSILEGSGPRRGNSVKDNILLAAPKNEVQATSSWNRFATIAQAICQVCDQEK
jgi:hypothetical protein